MPRQPKLTFNVQVQFRDTRRVVVRANDADEAIEKAAKRVERSGAEPIAFRVEAASAEKGDS